ncbi:hypothetical protein RE428_34850 [Marinobacter nanhaiticus D15-8W]|nr:hypothetical protein RE428_34850 [Marinobacter nanhaiticus D15-8W]
MGTLAPVVDAANGPRNLFPTAAETQLVKGSGIIRSQDRHRKGTKVSGSEGAGQIVEFLGHGVGYLQ